MVVALYVFVGNSGVLSFGHISFVASALGGGRAVRPVAEKPATMPSLFGFLADTTVGNVPSLLLAALVGGVFAFLAGLPLMRLSGSRPASPRSRCSRSRTTSCATTRRSGPA